MGNWYEMNCQNSDTHKTNCYDYEFTHNFAGRIPRPSLLYFFSIKAVIVACCLCLYVCAGPELETPHKQATITALRQNISIWRAGPERNKSIKMCKILFTITKYWSIEKLENLNVMKSCVMKRYFNTFSKLNTMKTAWWCVTAWTNVFCEMYRQQWN